MRERERERELCGCWSAKTSARRVLGLIRECPLAFLLAARDEARISCESAPRGRLCAVTAAARKCRCCAICLLAFLKAARMVEHVRCVRNCTAWSPVCGDCGRARACESALRKMAARSLRGSEDDGARASCSKACRAVVSARATTAGRA